MSRKTRKLMWSVPLVAAFAVIGAWAIFVALAPNQAQAHDLELPGAVSDLTAKADGTQAVDLSWKAPTTGGTPTGYRIDASGDGQMWTSIMADSGSTATTYRDEMVSGVLGDDRFYRVFALNSAGTGSVSRTAGPVNVPSAGAPGNVTNITASAMGRKAIKLTWSEPSSTGGTDAITKYLIAGATGDTAAIAETALDGLEVGFLPTTDDEDPATNTVLFATRDATTSYTLEGLMPSQTWYFRVYAYNGDKVSAESSETRSATTDALGKIGPATNLTAVADPVAATVNLYWYWPADDGGRDITHWLVEQKQTARGTDETSDPATFNEWTNTAEAHPVAAGEAFDAQATGLTAGAKYQFRVTARTGDETVDDSVGGSVSSRSSNSNTVTVNAVVDCTSITAVDTSLTGSDLANDRARFADETARCALNDAKTTNDTVSADRDGKGNVEVMVERENPRKATSFRIDVSIDGNMWQPVSDYTGNLGTDDEFVYEYEDLTTGGNLYYRVFARVGTRVLLPSNEAPQEAELKVVMMPGKVENLKATAISQTQIDVTWSAPKKDGDAVVDMYCVQARTTANGDGFDALATDAAHADDTTAGSYDTAKGLCMGTDTATGAADKFALTDMMMYSHKKLMAGETYYYKVYAINNPVYRGDNRSASSDTVSAKTMKQDKPTMPTGLTAETAKDSNYGGRVNAGVYLLWNAPPKPAGGMIGSYVVQRKVGDGSWSNVHSDSDTGSMRTIFHDTSEPADGEMRAYRVAAKNASGTSDWSNMVYYPAPMEHTHVMAKGTIAAQTVTVGMTTKVDASMYFTNAMSYSAMSDMPSYATATVDDMDMVTITGVAAGTAEITVTATDMYGGTATQMITVTVASASLTPASDVEGEVDGTEVTITWEGGENADTFTVVMVARKADGSWDIPNAVYDQNLSGSPHKVNMSTRPAGTYIIGVAAGTDDGEWTPWARGSVVYGSQPPAIGQ